MAERELYLREGLRYLPHLLELMDRNQASSTYGCLDRAYWHYRTSDFPSGMHQEGVLPLALAFLINHPENPFYRSDRLRELVIAGIQFAERSSHPDGSCDDYFPFERATGAAAFSLYACTEACLLLEIKETSFLEFFKKRGAYLAREGFDESGVLSNHKALIVLALFNVFLLTGDSFFKLAANEKLDHLLGLQTEEGWFPEYEGCDPGYLTFTIDFLAKYHQKSKDEKVLKPLERAIQFSSFFQHPDGSFGGEYGSRNTFHFLPHGFELLGSQLPVAVSMADLFLEAVERRRRSYLEDDRIFCHYVYNFLQAYRDFSPRSHARSPSKKEPFIRIFKEAGLVVKNSGNYYGVISLAKGGVAKIFKGKELVYCDSGLVGETLERKKFTSQVISRNEFSIEEEEIRIDGHCYEHRDLIFSPWSFLLFRVFLLAIGRFLSANFTRRILQGKAILRSKQKIPLRFSKLFSFKGPPFVQWTFHWDDPTVRLKSLWIASDATFAYMATSQPFQSGSLHGWLDLSEVIKELNEEQTAVWKQRLP